MSVPGRILEEKSRLDLTAKPLPRMLPIVAALGVMVVWAGTPMFSKIAAAHIDPLLVGVLRTMIAGLVAFPLVLRRPLPAGRRERRLLAFSGFAAFVAFPLLFTVGQHRTSALHGALILATLPVFTSLFGTLVERRRVSRTWMTGCSIALASEAAVILSRSDAVAGSTMLGDLCVLGSSVVCAMGYVAGARLSQRGYSALSTTLWGVSLSAVLLVPLLCVLIAHGGMPHAGLAAWGSVLTLAIFTSVLGYVAWYWALAHGGISRVASVQFTQPLFGIALAGVVFREWPGAFVAFAAAGVLAGARLVQKAGAR